MLIRPAIAVLTALVLTACATPESQDDARTARQDQYTRESGDARHPKTGYHATGNVRCGILDGTMTECPFGVKREGNGSGVVVVTGPSGQKRSIYFQNGKATGSDAGSVKTFRSGDVTTVYIGKERYDIVDAIIYGG